MRMVPELLYPGLVPAGHGAAQVNVQWTRSRKRQVPAQVFGGLPALRGNVLPQ